MKCFVDISTTFGKGMKPGPGRAEILIWTVKGGRRHESGPYLVEAENVTRQRLAILSVNEALKHFTKPGQEIIIRTDEFYVPANIQYLEKWHTKDYKTAGGRPVKNEDQWRLLWMHTRNQKIEFRAPEIRQEPGEP